MNELNQPIRRVSRNDPLQFTGRGQHNMGSDAAGIRLSSHPPDESIDTNKLEILPATADVFYGDTLPRFIWKGPLETLFSGTRDPKSTLAVLREHESTIVRDIYTYVDSPATHVKLTIPAALVGSGRSGRFMQFNHGRHGRRNWQRRDFKEADTKSSGFDHGFASFVRCSRVEFREPADCNVNMMPFILGDKESLPSELQCYFSLIEQCPYMSDDSGKVGYRTIHESFVDTGNAQRREGLHIESPGTFSDDNNVTSFAPAVEHDWGIGMFFGPDRYDGGIYTASSVAGTSEVWNALVDSRVPGLVDRHGVVNIYVASLERELSWKLES